MTRCLAPRHQSVERSLGRLDERGERRGVGDSQIGEDLAVDLDPRSVEAGDEPAVAHVVLPRSGVDPLDPQTSHLALAGATVTVGIVARPHDLLVGGPERTALVAVVALGLLQYLLVPLLRCDTTLHTCHFDSSSERSIGAEPRGDLSARRGGA